jgi:thiosulfate/3-mercaptopyruvate sulfurtransferase
MSALVSVGELAGLLDRTPAGVTLLDVRWALATGSDRDAYRSGHIPGAAFADLDADLAGPPGAGGRHPLPDPDRFVAAMRAAGVGTGRPVVVYDDASGVPAARAWWLLRHYGHRDVRLLDGGWAAWRRAGGAVEEGTPVVEPGDFDGVPGHRGVVDAEQAAALAAAGRLLDVRTPERFRGEQELVDPVAGHIPGAVNVPMARTVRGDGGLEDPSALREAFGALASDRVGVYCGSGVTAAHTVLALELIGVDAALYAGSWSDWITDPARPVATGE